MVKPTINSDKHYVLTVKSAIANGVRSNIDVVTVDNDLLTQSDVRVGAEVKAVYLEYWVDSASSSFTVTACVYKRSSGAGAISFADLLNPTAYANKKNILEYHQGLTPSSGNIIPLFRQWVLIPKGKQRMGLGDTVSVAVGATGGTVNVCGFTTFKEYF